MESTRNYLLTMKQWEADARERAIRGISEKLVNAGIIQQGQKEIAPSKIRAAFKAAYMPELLAQETKSSTGGAGKFADVANRCLMREARELPMAIDDLRCRNCSLKDVNVYIDANDQQTAGKLNRSRVAVEVKTGAGCLAQAGDVADSWQALADAVEADKLIVWYPFSIDGWQDGDIDIVDDAQCFFGTYGQLFSLLEGYNGGVETWLKVCGTAVNFQNVTSSGKKMAYLEEVCQQGWDWPMFRDWGRIREKG